MMISLVLIMCLFIYLLYYCFFILFSVCVCVCVCVLAKGYKKKIYLNTTFYQVCIGRIETGKA